AGGYAAVHVDGPGQYVIGLGNLEHVGVGAGVDVDGVDEDEGRSLRFAAAVAESADQLCCVVGPLDLNTFLVEDGTRGQGPDDLGDPGRLLGIGKAVAGGLLFV